MKYFAINLRECPSSLSLSLSLSVLCPQPTIFGHGRPYFPSFLSPPPIRWEYVGLCSLLLSFVPHSTPIVFRYVSSQWRSTREKERKKEKRKKRRKERKKEKREKKKKKERTATRRKNVAIQLLIRSIYVCSSKAASQCWFPLEAYGN